TGTACRSTTLTATWSGGADVQRRSAPGWPAFVRGRRFDCTLAEADQFERPASGPAALVPPRARKSTTAAVLCARGCHVGFLQQANEIAGPPNCGNVTLLLTSPSTSAEWFCPRKTREA